MDSSERKGKIYSWDVCNDTVAVKKCDKSFFDYNCCRVPEDLQWFFEAQELKEGGRQDVTILYRGSSYSAYLAKAASSRDRTRLFWEGSLGAEFAAVLRRCGSYPVFRLEKLSPGKYEAQFMDPEKIGRDQQTLRFEDPAEQDPAVREAAIRIHGTKCMTCGFDFASVYGITGTDFIEVHHIADKDDAAGQIDPDKDMVCLCSNCHSMIHRNPDRELLPEELERLIKEHSAVQMNIFDYLKDGLTI